MLLVCKKDGTRRFCVDYHALNTIMVKDCFPILTINELLDELYDTIWFSKMDLKSQYEQVCMHLGDIHKADFRTHQDHYDFLVIPFGLCNTPPSLQATMHLIFQSYLRKFVFVFFLTVS